MKLPVNELLWFAVLVLNFSAILIIYRVLGKIGLFVWIPISIILANIQVLKMVELFGMTTTLGNIVYATSFLATDILSENYGKKDAFRAVWIGFFSVLTMVVLMNLSLYFIPSEGDFAHDSLNTIFSLMPRIAAASLLAYLLSQRHDVWAYDFWKRKFPGDRRIWMRNNFSTMVSQLIDTLVFTLIAFWGLVSGSELIQILITTYLTKWLVAAADTPLIYIAKRMRDKVHARDQEIMGIS